MDWTKERSWTICDAAVERLNKLLDSIPDLNIVLSSTWRLVIGQQPTVDHLVKHGFRHAARVIDSTPDLTSWRANPVETDREPTSEDDIPSGSWIKDRADEILEWLNRQDFSHLITKWAIVDDQRDLFQHLTGVNRNNFVLTTWQGGLHDRHIEKLHAILD